MAAPILLTGSAGFVGRVIAPLLARAFPDRELVAVVRRPPAPPGGAACDLTVRADTEALVQRVRPGIVVHLAAYASVGLARQTPSAVWRDNVDASVRVARAVAQHAPEAIVLLTSTAEVYGRALSAGPATEATRPRPGGPYATSKLASEHVFATTLPGSARLIVVRPFNHTGPGQSEHFAIPSFAAQIARIEAGLAPPEITVGNLLAARDLLDVADVADGYVQLLARCLGEGRSRLAARLTVNVARGVATPIGDVLATLLGLSRVAVTVRVDPARLRPNEIAVATATTDRLAGLIDWPPSRPLAETLAAVLEDKRRMVAGSRPAPPAATDAAAAINAAPSAASGSAPGVSAAGVMAARRELPA